MPENGFEVVPIKKKKLPVLNADELALGQTLVTSRKRKRDIMDMAWNRYMFNDVDQVKTSGSLVISSLLCLSQISWCTSSPSF